MKVVAIVPAAGIGKRLKARTPKAFLRVSGKPLLAHTLNNLSRSYAFSELIVAADEKRVRKIRQLLRNRPPEVWKVVPGGKTRAESVWNALKAVSGNCDWVLVHDAARPLVSKPLVRRVLQAAKKTGAAICGLSVGATVKRMDSGTGMIRGTEDREMLWLAQTPQVFRRDLLVSRYRKLGRRAFMKTDEAALFDGTGVKVRMVSGDPRNIKITVPADLKLLEFYLESRHRV